MFSEGFEILDILVFISFMIQLDDHNKNRKADAEIQTLNAKVDRILNLLERKDGHA